jgi:hypothetical protein
MGYIIRESESSQVFKTSLTDPELLTLGSSPVILNPPLKPNYYFLPIGVYLSYLIVTPFDYSAASHLIIRNQGKLRNYVEFTTHLNNAGDQEIYSQGSGFTAGGSQYTRTPLDNFSTFSQFELTTQTGNDATVGSVEYFYVYIWGKYFKI